MKKRKPSSRTHRVKPMDGLNLTPFIDMITCLMFFLLMFAAMIPIVIIDAPLPKVASTQEEIQKAKDDEKQLDISIYVDSRSVRVKANGAGEKSFPVNNAKFPVDEVHKFLVSLHEKRPSSHEITIVPTDEVTWETMIDLMDVSRELVKTDTGYKPVPAEIAQKPESAQFNRLFPDVTIGGV